jgi:hypothetical protein
VPLEDEKALRVAPDGFVLSARHLDRLAAILMGALADEADQERVLLSGARETGLELPDSLVDLAEEGLVPGSPKLVGVHWR